MKVTGVLFFGLGAVALASGCTDASTAQPPAAASEPSRTAVQSSRPPASTPEPEPAAKPATGAKGRPPSVNPAATRVVAIGDVHGDFEATRRVLRLAGVMDAEDHWAGGQTVLVQTGDQLDRGDGEQAIIDLLSRLEVEAKGAGGAVHVLNGNHELMNALGDLRYVTPGGYADFEGTVDAAALADARFARAPQHARARLAAFLPGGPYARVLARRNVAVKIGDTVFVHGGVSPRYAEAPGGLETFNAAVSAWLAGDAKQAPAAAVDPQGPVWTRRYSQAVDAAACRDLDRSLVALGAARMVVGHTVQNGGITHACDKKVWRIDVGLASHYGSAPSQVLELRGSEVRVLAQ